MLQGQQTIFPAFIPHGCTQAKSAIGYLNLQQRRYRMEP